MPSILTFRRGTAAQNDAFTGSAGEITVDNTNGTLRVHDGVTAGGSQLATQSYVTTQLGTLGDLATLDTVGASQIDSNAVTTAKIADGSITSSKLDSGLQLGKTVGIHQVYWSDTQVTFDQGNTALTADFRYFNSAKIGGTFTKSSGTSWLCVDAHYSLYHDNRNMHDMYMWVIDSGGGYHYRHLGYDPNRFSNNRINHSFRFWFGAGDIIPTGSTTVWLSAGTGDSRTVGGALNYNPESYVSADTANQTTWSQMVVTEIEP